MSLPLEGLVIIDLTQIYNGPYATYLLALAGADVIKVEPPGGEALRRRGAAGGAALPFAMLNGCKKSIVLDLKSEEGRQALLGLVKGADVLVENFSPGVMDRLGLGESKLRTVNANLIYASSSGYGCNGPYSAYPAMDLTIQAISGIMHTTGYPDQPPVKAGPAVADFLAGTHLYGAIMTALFDREHSGRASRVEVAMQDAVYASLSSSLGLLWAGENSTVPSRTGNRHSGLAECPYNIYPTEDGFIAIICVGESHWESLVAAMENDDLAVDSRFATRASRIAHMDLIDDIVGNWTSGWNTHALFDMLTDVHVPCAPVRTLEEVVTDPNMHARNALQWQDHPELGRIVVQQTPIRFDGYPLRDLEPSRPLGADTSAVLGRIGEMGVAR